MKSFLVFGNVILCGVITFLLAYFFASGAFGENYKARTFVAPEFFLMVLMWGIGSLLLWWFFTRTKIENVSKTKTLLINISLWITIPVGFTISMSLAG